jgi:hypothetical protein
VVAAHLEDLRLTDGIVFLMFLRWMDEIEKEELVYKEVCSSYLPLLLTWYILLGLLVEAVFLVALLLRKWNLYNCLIQGVANRGRKSWSLYRTDSPLSHSSLKDQRCLLLEQCGIGRASQR